MNEVKYDEARPRVIVIDRGSHADARAAIREISSASGIRPSRLIVQVMPVSVTIRHKGADAMFLHDAADAVAKKIGRPLDVIMLGKPGNRAAARSLHGSSAAGIDFDTYPKTDKGRER